MISAEPGLDFYPLLEASPVRVAALHPKVVGGHSPTCETLRAGGRRPARFGRSDGGDRAQVDLPRRWRLPFYVRGMDLPARVCCSPRGRSAPEIGRETSSLSFEGLRRNAEERRGLEDARSGETSARGEREPVSAFLTVGNAVLASYESVRITPDKTRSWISRVRGCTPGTRRCDGGCVVVTPDALGARDAEPGTTKQGPFRATHRHPAASTSVEAGGGRLIDLHRSPQGAGFSGMATVIFSAQGADDE
jgi:hypothetical protein